MSLLDKAKAIRTPHKSAKAFNYEEVELALAFLNGEITGKQYSGALGCKEAANQSRAFGTIKRAARSGNLKFDLTH